MGECGRLRTSVWMCAGDDIPGSVGRLLESVVGGCKRMKCQVESGRCRCQVVSGTRGRVSSTTQMRPMRGTSGPLSCDATNTSMGNVGGKGDNPCPAALRKLFRVRNLQIGQISAAGSRRFLASEKRRIDKAIRQQHEQPVSTLDIGYVPLYSVVHRYLGRYIIPGGGFCKRGSDASTLCSARINKAPWWGYPRPILCSWFLNPAA